MDSVIRSRKKDTGCFCEGFGRETSYAEERVLNATRFFFLNNDVVCLLGDRHMLPTGLMVCKTKGTSKGDLLRRQ